jgi:hypothetical protein
MGSAIIHPKEVRETIACQKDACRLRWSSGVPPALVVEGTGHLPVDPIEVLFRLLLKGDESLDFFTDFSLQRFHITVKRGHTSENGHRLSVYRDGPSQGSQYSLLPVNPKEHLTAHEARLKGRMPRKHPEPAVRNGHDHCIDRSRKHRRLWGEDR